MKACFPIAQDEGLDSHIFPHFNSAPFFLLIDTDTDELQTIGNCDPANELHGCNPSEALKDRQFDAIVVIGVSDALLQLLNLMGNRVFEAAGDTARENIEKLRKKELEELTPFYSQFQGGHDDDDDEGEDEDEHGGCDHDEEPDDCSGDCSDCSSDSCDQKSL
jgi:predicted Fe-Mo cluster-binding NifX family protein